MFSSTIKWQSLFLDIDASGCVAYRMRSHVSDSMTGLFQLNDVWCHLT